MLAIYAAIRAVMFAAILLDLANLIHYYIPLDFL
jgi:hypothetical protein